MLPYLRAEAFLWVHLLEELAREFILLNSLQEYALFALAFPTLCIIHHVECSPSKETHSTSALAA